MKGFCRPKGILSYYKLRYFVYLVRRFTKGRKGGKMTGCKPVKHRIVLEIGRPGNSSFLNLIFPILVDILLG